MFRHLPADVLSILKLENNTNWGKSAFNSKVDVLLQNDNESKATSNTKENFSGDLQNLKSVLFHNKDKNKRENMSKVFNFVVDDTFLTNRSQKESGKLIENMQKTVKFKREDRLSTLSVLVCEFLNENRKKKKQRKIIFFLNLRKIQSELDKVLYEYSLPPQGISKLFVLTSHLFSF
jgi:hypothetical protein